MRPTIGHLPQTIFENTRDVDYCDQTLAPRAFQKISDSNAQWYPQDNLPARERSLAKTAL